MKSVALTHTGRPAVFEDLLCELTRLSRAEVRLIIEMGGAYVGKMRCKDPNQKVRAGERVSAYYQFPIRMEPVAFDPAWVLADDGAILVADKPAGLPTQGRRDADYMAFYEVLKQNLRGYLGLHHRLDQDTSGLMLFTRSTALNKAVSDAFREGRVRKKYMTVAVGPWPFEGKEQLIQAPIGPQQTARGVLHRVHASGKPARTEIHLIDVIEDGLLLIQAQPLTGRTHQIRVHLAHCGIPLWGDALYGQARTAPFLLHCFSLAWPADGRLAAGHYQVPPPPAWSAILPDASLARVALGEVG